MVKNIFFVIIDRVLWCDTSEAFYIFLFKRGRTSPARALVPGDYVVIVGQV